MKDWTDVEMELAAYGNDDLAEWVHKEVEAMRREINTLRGQDAPDYRGACRQLFRLGYIWVDGQWYLPSNAYS